MYFTDRGIEELVERRGAETVTLEWVGEQLRTFVDAHPEFETPIERARPARAVARPADAVTGSRRSGSSSLRRQPPPRRGQPVGPFAVSGGGAPPPPGAAPPPHPPPRPQRLFPRSLP